MTLIVQGELDQKVNPDFCIISRFSTLRFFSKELNEHLDFEVKSISVGCERCAVSAGF